MAQSSKNNETIEEKQLNFDSIVKNLKTYTIVASQYASERPLSAIAIQPSSKMFATSSWSGEINLFSLPESKACMTLKGHIQRACSIDWHPDSGQSITGIDLCSASTDGSIFLYSTSQETPVSQLVGHDLRVACVKFHPNGKIMGTASHDCTWRLFDLETQVELCLQENTEKIHALAFHPDGSLVATGYLFNLFLF